MQEPASYDISMFQGASWDLSLTWKTGSPLAPVNLTGWSAAMQVRTEPGSGTVMLELSTGNGRIVLGGAAGTVNLSLGAGVTEDLEAGMYVYDLELYAGGGGQVVRLIMGSITVVPEVTRWLS